ncbi:MAG TPA: hypothetical protein IAC25_04675 [Candidatus Enterenecus stercoripullorum]|nr:hypothetical protein [Candidatus Enterenecus stercoripullorum]
MAQTGSLLVRTFVSRAEIPIPGATAVVAVPTADGRQKILAVRITDESGIAGPFELPAPDVSSSLSPDLANPFSNYILLVEHPGYELATFLDLQIFPGVQTVQDIPMVPLETQGTGNGVTIVTPQPL